MVGIFSNKYEFKKNIQWSLFCNGRKIRYKRDTASTKWSIWQALSLNFLMVNVTWLLKRVTEKEMYCHALFWCFLSCVTDTSEDKPKIARKFELFSFRDLSLIIFRLKATCVLVMICTFVTRTIFLQSLQCHGSWRCMFSNRKWLGRYIPIFFWTCSHTRKHLKRVNEIDKETRPTLHLSYFQLQSFSLITQFGFSYRG